MSRISVFLSFLAVFAFAVSLGGCGGKDDSPASKPAKQGSDTKQHDTHDHADHDHAEHDHAGEKDSKIEEALSKLSAADRAAAEKQKTCPVSGEPLGSMGTPIKVTIKGREVFLCCKGCEETIKKDPDKYLQKLK